MATERSTAKRSVGGYDLATRAQIVALRAYGISAAEIRNITQISERTIRDIYRRAIDRGFDPRSSPLVLNTHVDDASRPGRPSKQTEDTKNLILEKVRRDRYGREKTCAYIAAEVGGVSAPTVWRILRASGLRKTKPTRKPGLTENMKLERHKFCMDHAHQKLEDWKNVIWSDETSVVLNHRRGGYRIWRAADKRFVKSCIRPRWKGYSEFMFWGCFSYNKKGPCHIWQPETAAERKKAQAVIDKLNKELEPRMREEWELNTGIRRMGLRNRPGPKPGWKFTEATGKLVQNQGYGGIDWWRY